MLTQEKNLQVVIKEIKEIIHLATLAPSGHNTQPWLFSINSNKIIIIPDYSRSLPIVDPDDHALFISLGCALENLILAANHYGYKANVEYRLELHKKEKIIVELEEGYTEHDPALFNSIKLRQATRCTYNKKPIPKEHIELLRKAADLEGIFCKFYIGDEVDSIIPFVKEGNKVQFEDKAFLKELKAWIRFSKVKSEKLKDGIRSAVMGAPSVPDIIGKMVMSFASAESEAKKCEKMIRNSSALVLFITENDYVKNWINLGRSFQRFALKATSLGIKHAHLNMPCEVISVREKLKKHLHLTHQEPLLLLRLGYSEPMPYSYRRDVEDVIISEK